MNVREKMIKWRKKKGLTLEHLSKEAEVSETLLQMVENGEVTHPNIVKRIARVYGLTEKQSYELLPENYRPNSPLYDPKRYVEEVPDSRFSIHGARDVDKNEL